MPSRTTGGLLDLLVMAGPGPDEVAAQYSRALGRYYIPPYWALGYHQVVHCPGLLLYCAGSLGGATPVWPAWLLPGTELCRLAFQWMPR